MRIYAEPSDQMLKEINQAVKERGIGKTQIVLEAIDQYLHGSDQGETTQVKAELDKANSDLNQSQGEITRLKLVITSLEADLYKERSLGEELQIKNDHLEKTSDQASSDIAQVKAELDKTKSEMDKTKLDLNQYWSEITRLRSEITALKADLDKARSLADKLVIENDRLRKASDQASSDLEILKRDHQHFKDTLDMKDKQITFLEGHVSQLVQLALPPSEEEAKKKGWWQFWRS